MRLMERSPGERVSTDADFIADTGLCKNHYDGSTRSGVRFTLDEYKEGLVTRDKG